VQEQEDERLRAAEREQPRTGEAGQPQPCPTAEQQQGEEPERGAEDHRRGAPAARRRVRAALSTASSSGSVPS
jgi:hypothetical protein